MHDEEQPVPSALSKGRHEATKYTQNAIEGVVEERDPTQNEVNQHVTDEAMKRERKIPSEKLRYENADQIYE